MVRPAGKHNCGRVMLVSCRLPLGFFSDGVSPPSSVTTVIGKLPPNSNEKDTKKKNDKVWERKLSATSQLQWEKMGAAPVPRLDGAAIQLGIFSVFAGYGNIDLVHSHVDIYNFVDNTWVGRFDMPKEMAHSHLGMVSDGRYIYIVTGQYGPQCRGPTAKTFVLDTDTNTWTDFISLPVPRYSSYSAMER